MNDSAIDELKREIEFLKAIRETFRRKLDEVMRERDGLRADRDMLRSQIQKLTEENKNLNGRLLQTQEGAQALRDLLQQAQAECGAMRRALVEIRDEPAQNFQRTNEPEPRYCFHCVHKSKLAFDALSGSAGKEWAERMEKLERMREALKEVMGGYEANPPSDFDWVGWYERAKAALVPPAEKEGM